MRFSEASSFPTMDGKPVSVAAIMANSTQPSRSADVYTERKSRKLRKKALFCPFCVNLVHKHCNFLTPQPNESQDKWDDGTKQTISH